MIINPILPGFNPDPSICRVGNDYYIATSTFEWYPGVQIHHSRDLANWTLVKRPLDRASQLDMRGNPDSCGIWAPCLSWSDGLFWLVYTDVKRLDGNFKDSHNYIVTAPSIEGPWSDPIYVNSSGFDPSLFHDKDGRKWFLNMIWNHRTESVGGKPKHPAFAGILMQEYDHGAGKLVGEVKNISQGSLHGLVEGAHIYRRKGWYYLTVAEGGTGYAHAVTMLRSRALDGPYELHPDIHLITSKDAPDAVLQRAGHGQIIETPEGEVYHTHLCSRPLPGTRLSPLGRETAIQKCYWGDDEWLYLEGGGAVPSITQDGQTPAKNDESSQVIQRQFKDQLPPEFQWLRTPYPDRIFSLDENGLKLIARESLGSWFEQSLVARRQEHFKLRAETTVSFSPETIQQAAGIIHYYNRHKFHFAGITWHETHGRVLTLLSCPGDWLDNRLSFSLSEPISIPDAGMIELAMEIDHAQLHFYYRSAGSEDWLSLGPTLDASLISDEAGRGEHASFTGAFVGMAAFDTSGSAIEADFQNFDYYHVE